MAMDTLGQRVERAITESGASPGDIAKACHVSVQAVYAWKRGQVKDLRNDNLFALADITGFEARWIGTGQGPDKTAEDKRLNALVKGWPLLDERGRASVLRVAELESEYGAEHKPDTA